jgi:hypothetical protein
MPRRKKEIRCKLAPQGSVNYAISGLRQFALMNICENIPAVKFHQKTSCTLEFLQRYRDCLPYIDRGIFIKHLVDIKCPIYSTDGDAGTCAHIKNYYKKVKPVTLPEWMHLRTTGIHKHRQPTVSERVAKKCR